MLKTMFLVSILAAACTSSGVGSTTGAVKGNNNAACQAQSSGAACTADADCAADEECDDGKCKLHECNDSADDDANDDNGTDPDDPNDDNGNDPGGGSAQCTVNADCASGLECEDGICKAHGGGGH